MWRSPHLRPVGRGPTSCLGTAVFLGSYLSPTASVRRAGGAWCVNQGVVPSFSCRPCGLSVERRRAALLGPAPVVQVDSYSFVQLRTASVLHQCDLDAVSVLLAAV